MRDDVPRPWSWYVSAAKPFLFLSIQNLADVIMQRKHKVRQDSDSLTLAAAEAYVTVGDIAPREGIPKEDKRRLEAVRDFDWFFGDQPVFTDRDIGGNAQLCARNAA